MSGQSRLILNIKIRFWVAVFLLALVSMSSTWFMHTQLEYRSAYASSINLSGRQRMLTIRTRELVKDLLHDKVPERSRHLREQLRDTVGALAESHQKLTHNFETLPSKVSAVFHEADTNVEAMVHSFIHAAENLVNTPDLSMTRDNPDFVYINSSADTLLAAFESETAKWQGLAEKRVQQTHWAEMMALVAFLLTLGGLILIVFRPAIRRLRHEMTSLSNTTEALMTRTKELEEAKKSAEEANLAKSKFLANMSHELRTPLNAVIGYSELMEEEAVDLGQSAIIPDLNKINTAGRHLLALINDILDLSKIEAGKIEMEYEVFAVGAMVEEVATTVRPLMEKNANRFIVSLAEDAGEIYSDQMRMRQVLSNLLSNAAKFTHEGDVTLDVWREAREGTEWLLFRVSDTGIGMNAEQQNSVFNAFEQADLSTTRRYGGTGLGLAISRKFCGMLGGEIDVESEPGKGSVFTVQFPQVEPADQLAELPPIDSAGGVVLVIDDDPSARELIRRQLSSSREGYQVVVSANGEVGLQMARELRPAVILLDIMMPDLNGWAVLKALKAGEETAGIPVIMCSILEERQEAYALGIADYLIKPIDRGRLISAVGRYSRVHHPCRALVVEDDGPTRELLRRTLAQSGWTVAEAVNGFEGLEQFDEQRPDVILLDLMMPEMDGFRFLEVLHKREGGRDVPVIVVTAKELTAEDHRRLNGYVERIVQKGIFTGDELLREVNRLVSGLGRHNQASDSEGDRDGS